MPWPSRALGAAAPAGPSRRARAALAGQRRESGAGVGSARRGRGRGGRRRPSLAGGGGARLGFRGPHGLEDQRGASECVGSDVRLRTGRADLRSNSSEFKGRHRRRRWQWREWGDGDGGGGRAREREEGVRLMDMDGRGLHKKFIGDAMHNPRHSGGVHHGRRV